MSVCSRSRPGPGPSSESVAIPRCRNTDSQAKNSSLVESRPGIRTTSGAGRGAAGGRRRFATRRPRRAPPRSARRWGRGARGRRTGRGPPPRCCAVALRIEHPHELREVEVTAARRYASPALRVSAAARGLLARARRWPSAVAVQASSHSSQRLDRGGGADEVVVVDAVGDEPAGPVADRRLHTFVGHVGAARPAGPYAAGCRRASTISSARAGSRGPYRRRRSAAASSRSAATLPISRWGTRTDVSGGRRRSMNGMSLKPTIEMSLRATSPRGSSAS